MYHVSPLTYLIAGIAAAGLAGAPIECATEELLRFLPPTNVSCEIYMQPYISYAGGKLVQSGIDAAKCQYCPLSTNDEFLNNYAMYYDQRWRNLGLQFVYLAFNVAATFGLYWLCRERTKSGR